MDQTELIQLQESLERAREEQARERQIREIGRRMLDEGQDLRGLVQAALDGLLDFLEFERGFLLVAEAPAGGAEEGDEGSSFRIQAARRRREGAGSGRGAMFEGLSNPEFAVNRSVAKRAFRSLQVLTVNDCLIQPQAAGAEVHRSVLCQPFAASPGVQAAIYLDRGLGAEPALEALAPALAEWSERCLPILCRGFLAKE